MKQLNKYKHIFIDFIFYFAILIFIIGFNFSDNMAGGWYQQFMPNLGGRQIVDITFTDSLNGYSITNRLSTTDTSFILRTTNSGDNWTKVYSETTNSILNRIQFINQTTGFVGGYIYANSTFHFIKTTNSGLNWFYVDAPFDVAVSDMYFLNMDTIWLVDNNSLVGGVFRTTNGGASWDQQLALGNQNPNHIYMFNGRIGFIGKDNVYLRRTTNSGLNWDTISGAGGFLDMYFADSLTGWKTSMQKTTDGGLTWINQILPQGGNIVTSQVRAFSNINRDTIWGVGGTIISGSNGLGIIYRTIDGGDTWMFQTADTSIHIFQYFYNEFTNKFIGWAYNPSTGVHTTTGGDPIFYTSIKQISSKTLDAFKLEQNYPNPFNPSTVIKFDLKSTADIKIAVYDVTGKEVTVLADKEYKTGTYEVTFNSSNYSSGVYFYSLYADGKLFDTKRMVLIK